MNLRKDHYRFVSCFHLTVTTLLGTLAFVATVLGGPTCLLGSATLGCLSTDGLSVGWPLAAQAVLVLYPADRVVACWVTPCWPSRRG